MANPVLVGTALIVTEFGMMKTGSVLTGKEGEMGMKEAIIQYNDLPSGGHMAISWKPLVRCRDCKYNDDGECIIKAGWFPVNPNWFCADGERKEGR